MKIVLSVLYFASVSLGAVLGKSGISSGSACLNRCYTPQGRAYCCSSAGSYRSPFASGISTFQQPFSSSIGSIQESYQPLTTGTFGQNTGLTAVSYHQPSAITTDAYHQQVLSTGTYNAPTGISSSSGLQASAEGNYQQSSVASGSLQDSTAGTIGSILQSSTITNSTSNAGFSRQPATTIGSGLIQQDTTLAGGAIQQPVSTITGSYQQPAAVASNLPTLVNEDAYVQSLAGAIGSFQPNIQTTDSFGFPLVSALSSPISEDNYHGTTTLGGGTYQRTGNYRQPLTSQRNYNQQLTTGTVSYQRPVSNVRGSYGNAVYQQPSTLSAGAYQRYNNQLF